MSRGQNKNAGFTIVELLIVIVVIGILAALVFNTFSGIQKEARNTDRITSANSYLKMFTNYATINGSYPVDFHFCLGEGYPDTDGNGRGECGTNGSLQTSGPVNDRLREVGSNDLPSHNKRPVIAANGDQLLGIHTSNSTSGRVVDGVEQDLFIIFYLEGDEQDCRTPRIVREVTPSSNNWTTGHPFTRSDGKATTCIISAPAPWTM